MNCSICDIEMTIPIVKDLVKCPECGLYRRSVPPSDDAIRNKLKGFLLSACKSEKGKQGRLTSARIQMDFSLKGLNPGKLYDVGAAGGFVMKVAQDMGWEVFGNEVSTAGISYAKKVFGIQIDYGFLEDLNYPKEHFDAIILWNTLEHVQDPKKILRICNEMLKTGGVIAIEVPNKDEGQVIKYYETLHLTEFNKENLLLLLKKSGFSFVRDRVSVAYPSYLHIDVLCKKD